MTLRRYTIYAARFRTHDDIDAVALRIIRTTRAGDVEHAYTLRERDLVRALRDAGFIVGRDTQDALANANISRGSS